jgi:TPR repeat protein
LIGQAMDRDPVLAMTWFEKAAALGDAAGLTNAARGYATGVEKDPMRALAINARIPAAERMDDGKVILSLTEPVRIMRLASRHARAQRNLGSLSCRRPGRLQDTVAGT